MLPSTSRASNGIKNLALLTKTRVNTRFIANAASTSKECTRSAFASESSFVTPDAPKPTSFIRVLDRQSSLTKALYGLESAAQSKNPVHALRVCLQMKRLGLKPTTQFYRLLMDVFVERGLLNEVEALWQDAIAMGINPDQGMYNSLLQARARHPFRLLETLQDMRQARHEPNATTYRIVMQHHANARNLLMCLRTLQRMKESGIAPDISTVETLVTTASLEFLPRLAHELAVDYEQKSARRLNLAAWTHILAASAHCFYTAGVVEGWRRVVVDGGITPDEGICTMVLNASGVAGLPGLAEEAIRQLQTMRVPLQEYHVSPLILALAQHGEVATALEVFDLMDQHDIRPTRFTARALIKLLSNPDHMQTALEYLRNRAETKGNLVGAYNCVLVAGIKDWSRTMALGKEMDDLKVMPTIDTYNILIHGACIRRNVSAAHSYYEEILQRGLEPNKETYERIIVLLTSEPVYDDAFLYLHKMTSSRLVPSQEVLVGLAKKCSIRFDARWKSLVKQMEKHGYAVDDELMKFLVSNGKLAMSGPDSEITEISDAALVEEDSNEQSTNTGSLVLAANPRPTFE